jgi:hypothetical protein
MLGHMRPPTFLGWMCFFYSSYSKIFNNILFKFVIKQLVLSLSNVFIFFNIFFTNHLYLYFSLTIACKNRKPRGTDDTDYI